MKPGTLTHTIAVILSSASSLFSPSAPAAVPAAKVKLSKKSSKPLDDALLKVDPISYSPAAKADPPLVKPAEHYAWKKEIVTTVFRTDHWQYVFGNERPKPNLNKGAGLDVSPAVRDYLGLEETDVTDWKFVEFSEVPRGPWSKHGDNNTFVINQHKSDKALVEGPKPGGMTLLP